MSGIDEYRRWAAECLAFAERAGHAEDKASWIGLAGKWHRLAEDAAHHQHVAQGAEQPDRDNEALNFGGKSPT